MTRARTSPASAGIDLERARALIATAPERAIALLERMLSAHERHTVPPGADDDAGAAAALLYAAYVHAGQTAPAHALAQRWGRLAPNDPAAQLAHAMAAHAAGATAEATAAIARAIAAAPESPDPHLLACAHAAQARDWGGARTAALRALALGADPDTFDADDVARLDLADAVAAARRPPRLPTFTYHPDPVATGAVRASTATCPACRRARGYAYVGPCYGPVEITDLCPWCIADGHARAALDVELVDTAALVGVPAATVAEIAGRTPGIASAQDIPWPAHCDDGMVYLGAREARGGLDHRFACRHCERRVRVRDRD